MNIFSLSDCPVQSAKWMVDKHVVKQILESCQLLCTTYQLQGIGAPYKKTHQNHPSNIWTRNSFGNFSWLLGHTFTLLNEYTERYGKIHKSKSVAEWCENNISKLGFDRFDLEPFAIAISDNSICRTKASFDENNPVHSYRLYYKYDKSHLHQWKQNRPDWIDTVE